MKGKRLAIQDCALVACDGQIGQIGEARWNDCVRHGIELVVAWTKDGNQVVGMSGTQLAEALAEYED